MRWRSWVPRLPMHRAAPPRPAVPPPPPIPDPTCADLAGRPSPPHPPPAAAIVERLPLAKETVDVAASAPVRDCGAPERTCRTPARVLPWSSILLAALWLALLAGLLVWSVPRVDSCRSSPDSCEDLVLDAVPVSALAVLLGLEIHRTRSALLDRAAPEAAQGDAVASQIAAHVAAVEQEVRHRLSATASPLPSPHTEAAQRHDEGSDSCDDGDEAAVPKSLLAKFDAVAGEAGGGGGGGGASAAPEGGASAHSFWGEWAREIASAARAVAQRREHASTLMV